MCGIFGVTGDPEAALTTTEALSRMAYRGYDSAGVASLQDGHLHRNRAVGKISALKAENRKNPLPGRIAIGHTRWATHGSATKANAHPHICNRVSLVHNGIIENHAALRDECRAAGFTPEGETDSEVIALLIEIQLASGASPETALRRTIEHLRGTFAIAALFTTEPDKLYAAKMGSPLAIGRGNGCYLISSDALSLAPLTSRACYLEDGDIAIISPEDIAIFDADRASVRRAPRDIEINAEEVRKGDHPHFMSKEMHEQPEAIARTLASQIDLTSGTFTGTLGEIDFSDTRRLHMIACGTSFYACQVAKYWIESLSGIPVEVDIASEAAHRDTPIGPRDTAIFVSQSGETADTLAALSHIKRKGARIISLVNVTQSTIARESDAALGLQAGPEIGVASTKAFTCQLALLSLLAIKAGRDTAAAPGKTEDFLAEISSMPGILARTLLLDAEFKELARAISTSGSTFFVGRGVSFPLAMEGALKLKEISYIHAEGFAGGEMKHGPIALVEPAIPTIVLSASGSPQHEKTLTAAQEIAARGGPVHLVSDATVPPGFPGASSVTLPSTTEYLSPFTQAVAVQMIAYHTALLLGRDIDQPRNLAKAVTV